MSDETFTYEAIDYVQALRLAMEASATLESEHALVERILTLAPEGDPQSTVPTRILVDAIRALGASVEVP